MLRHSIITLAIFAIATILFATGVTTEEQPHVFILAFVYWVAIYVFKTIRK